MELGTAVFAGCDGPTPPALGRAVSGGARVRVVVLHRAHQHPGGQPPPGRPLTSRLRRYGGPARGAGPSRRRHHHHPARRCGLPGHATRSDHDREDGCELGPRQQWTLPVRHPPKPGAGRGVRGGGRGPVSPTGDQPGTARRCSTSWTSTRNRARPPTWPPRRTPALAEPTGPSARGRQWKRRRLPRSGALGGGLAEVPGGARCAAAAHPTS
jgi:hypothetical protein